LILTTAMIVLLRVVVARIRSAVLAFALSNFLYGQTSNSAPQETQHSDILDKALELVGPVPAASPPHKERFGEFVRSTIGPVPLLGEAAGAAIGQWMNAPKEWGQGWDAFAKRYGSNLAYNGIRQTITYAGSVVLGEDSRYFASGRTGFWPRTRHALASTFTARHADGRVSFAYSSTAGVIGASAISSVWGPDAWRGPGKIATNAGISFASTAAFNVVREFLPDIFRRPRK
jgi:hypothetical protein